VSDITSRIGTANVADQPSSEITTRQGSIQSGPQETVSSLAKDLSKAASYAGSVNGALSTADIRDKARRIIGSLEGDASQVGKDSPDVKSPASGDFASSSRASQAEEFAKGNAENPFKGLSRDQLSVIVYDESETFTLSERRAALSETRSQEGLWQKSAANSGVNEFTTTGSLDKFVASAQSYYRSLPEFDKAQYPENQLERIDAVSKVVNGNTSKEIVSENISNVLGQPVLSATRTVLASNSPATGNIQGAVISAKDDKADDEGQKILRDRLFGGNDPSVVSGSSGMSTSNISRSPHDFLTSEDRDFLASVYSHSKSQGVDLDYVDQLAGELGDYRRHDDGRLSRSFNDGTNYDVSGHRLTVSFSQEDSDTAARILNGKALSSTGLDKGFINHILDPGYGALTNTSSLRFLEKVVVQSSREADPQADLGADFSNYIPLKNIKDNVRITAEASATLPPFEPDIKNENGSWVVTDKGRSAGVTLDQWKKHSVSTDATALRYSYILDALSEKPGIGKQASWLSQLIKGFNS